LVQSITTAVLQHCPARLVPPPRDSTGAPNSAQTLIAAAAASGLRGTTDFAVHLVREYLAELAGVHA
jgi:hypothetical protein